MRQVLLSALSLSACFGTVGVPQTASAQVKEPHLLQADPPCIDERMGRVRVTLGDGRPDPRRGGVTPTVSYGRALAKLRAAAAERGADAVVLREHQADYFAKGSRRPSRPTYVMLSGAAVRLRSAASGCALVVIDPVEFERSALGRDRANVSENAGVSF
jgi:hypothetical protein